MLFFFNLQLLEAKNKINIFSIKKVQKNFARIQKLHIFATHLRNGM